MVMLENTAILEYRINTSVQYKKEETALRRASAYMEISKKAYAKFALWIQKYGRYEEAERNRESWTLFVTQEQTYRMAFSAYEAHRRCHRVKRNILFNIIMDRL